MREKIDLLEGLQAICGIGSHNTKCMQTRRKKE